MPGSWVFDSVRAVWVAVRVGHSRQVLANNVRRDTPFMNGRL